MALPSVSDYLAYLKESKYPELFDQNVYKKLHHITEKFGDLQTEETILEIPLSTNEKKVDYSIRIDTKDSLSHEYWYELDSAACCDDTISPCYFIDASTVKPNMDNSDFFNFALKKLAGEERLNRLMPMINRCVNALNQKCSCIFQFGAMTGRNQNKSLRLFTDDMTRPDLVAYLQELNWDGNISHLNSVLQEWEPFCDRKKFILDFDIFEDHISNKIGINFGTKNKNNATIEKWLDFLVERNLCLPEKKLAVLKFVQTFPNCDPFIQNDISHFKFPIINGKITMAKAYLRQGNKCFVTNFKAYNHPILMNLELTSRCPLHCPQCYCDLEKGKDLPLDKALYWINQAAKTGIKIINLSGGETMCYRHIFELLSACHERGLETNIAVSGWGITDSSATKLIQNGVSTICVSLNGSTAEINSKSRDGYELAINALNVLKRLHFESTAINWVMHSFNAEDFPQIIKIAEKYDVKELAVMMFKPNSSHELPSIPSQAQFHLVGSWIKSYKGPVKIEIEECFSQMRAFTGKRFWGNTNRGVSRGCGAGRDGISVSADGKLTPCRHLELEEDWSSIQDYWNHSEILTKLRSLDDYPQKPCSNCELCKYCLPCAAVNWKQKGTLLMGDSTCPIQPQSKF